MTLEPYQEEKYAWVGSGLLIVWCDYAFEPYLPNWDFSFQFGI